MSELKLCANCKHVRATLLDRLTGTYFDATCSLIYKTSLVSGSKHYMSCHEARLKGNDSCKPEGLFFTQK